MQLNSMAALVGLISLVNALAVLCGRNRSTTFEQIAFYSGLLGLALLPSNFVVGLITLSPAPLRAEQPGALVATVLSTGLATTLALVALLATFVSRANSGRRPRQ